MNGWKSYNYEARIEDAGLILFDFYVNGCVVASIYQASEDDYLNDTCRVWDWAELAQDYVFELDYRANRGRDEITCAMEYVERKHAAVTGLNRSFGRSKAKAKAAPIDFSQFDGFVTESAHEFDGFTPQASAIDTFLTEISEDFGGL